MIGDDPTVGIVETDDQLERQVNTLELINDELENRLARQFESDSKVDTKAGVLAGFSATAAQFLATQHTQPIIAGLAFVGYAVAFAFGTWSLAVSAWRSVPEPRHLVDVYVTKSRAHTLAALVSTKVQACEANVVRRNRKVRHWRVGLAAFTLGFVFSVAAIISG